MTGKDISQTLGMESENGGRSQPTSVKQVNASISEPSSVSISAQSAADVPQAQTLSQLPIEPSPENALPAEDDFFESPPAVEPVDPADIEAELGDIEIIERPVAIPAEQPTGQLIFRSSIFSSSNISGVEDSVTGDSNDSDALFSNSLFFLATPDIGPRTRLISSAGGGLVQFSDNEDSDYNFLNLSLAVQRRVTPAIYGELGVNWQQIYANESGERSLSDISPRFRIGRQDRLSDQLRLDSVYELQFRLTDPAEQQRISNALGVKLNYDLAPRWRTGLEYRLTLDDFTQERRFDTRNLVRALTTYNFNEDAFVSGNVSYLFGSSSESSVDIENLSVGITFGVNAPLF
ncbi:MAG: hypothetical protein AAFQ23_12865 [Cyanobacteria bacterium J06623_1]